MKKIFSLLAFSAVLVASAQAQQESDSMLTQELEEVVVSSRVIDVAKERVTPVAVSTISASDVALKVGNLEFPEIMNNTPGVYATKQGGGYGDSRISLRGFSQSNTAFLINGQPVNDMENGWVYWSNWQGLTDVTSSIQIQRGLGASRLAVPSVGGTVSIFTKAADRQAGGVFAQMLGNDGYTKTTAVHNTGTNEKGWATSLLLTYWKGDGYINSTKGEGWTYFASVGYSPEDSNHSFNLTMLGAGQWHHQRDAWVSIRDYQNFGTDHKDGIDRRWNTNGGTLNGEEYNMRRNFYNKPLATFNWDWDISDNVQLNTSVYASAGRGGGTGPRGNNFRNGAIDMYPYNIDLTTHYLENGRGTRFPDGTINFDAVVATNRANAQPYSGAISGYSGKLIGSNGFRNDGVSREILIRRASMNSHDWVGAISSLDIRADKFRYSLGVDLRSYTGYHYRVLNDLLGLDGYYSTGNRNTSGLIIETTVAADPFRKTGIRGPKIDYYNLGIVKWAGFNGLVEYNNDDKFTSVLQAGLSSQSYQRVDYFDQVGNPISEVQNSPGGYLKGGANINLNANNNVFFNAGYIARQPLFDAVFPGFANNINPDLQNEKITSVEAGYGYASSSFKLNANVYSTVWGNRFISRGFTLDGGTSGTAQFKDVDVLHQGIELEATYYASPDFRLKGMLSAGDWKYTKDFTSEVFDDTNQKIGEGTIYIKDAKVGDAAQFVAYTEAMYRVGDISFDLGYRFVDGLYADYSIVDSAFLQANNDGAVKLPSYGLVDFGAMARFDLFGNNASFRVNINNLFDTVYIAESNTNIHATSGSQTWNGVDVRNSVWFGFGRTWNATLRVNL
jgi:outer membrane cobalamin receptor